MRSRPTFWIVLCLLLAAGAWLFWPHAKRVVVKKFEPPIAGPFHSASTAPQIFPLKAVSKNSGKTVAASAASETNQFAYRLSNTAKSIGELQRDSHAILLENALIDTRAKMDFSIPKNLQAQGDPGAYIVQANGTIGPAFRAMLAASGAQIVSYIPNNAYLVRISAGGAGALAANPLAQSVIPWEPYYKVQPPLLAFDQTTLPAGAMLNLGLFADNPAATVQQIEKLGGTVLSQESEPFGLEVRVQPPPDWTALAQLPGVQIVEENHARELDNDLSRVTTGVAVNTTTNLNYLGLTGSNVIVAVDDSGVDATHPDFSVTGSAEAPGTVPPSRVIGDAPQSLVDTNGHGTFVAGEIVGNGSESYTITNIPQGSVSNADFRGKAPMATLYSVGGIGGGADTNVISDRYLQESAALTNALIANESWGYGDNTYDLAAASYDAAVRDALMGVTGSQPVLFVFAAGNDGHIGTEGDNGDNDGGGGTPDTISSPGTAKDVITVGALEQLRNITNIVTALDGTSNAVWQPATDSSSQVADYSSRGNVGIGTEGAFGRFKPDVVAPGSFVISTRSTEWDQVAYYNPTNYYVNDATFQLVDTNLLNYYNFPFVVQNNAVSVSIQVQPNSLSPAPFPPDMPIYVSLNNYPDPANPGTYDFETMNDGVTIPPDGGVGYLQSIINNLGGFNFAVGDSTNIPVNYDLVAEMVTTNDMGDYYTVLSNLNNTLGPWYRYESGTSMAAADVSGVLALMQDFFTNTLHIRPSPAMLKAMLINGARPTGFYNLQVNNNINLEGWGLVNLPNSIPAGITNTTATAINSFFFVDQSPTNEVATGDSRTYNISLSPGATAVPLRLTLAWTDPPGNPAAAIKLVNNLDLIVTNTDNSTNPVVYYGNDIGPNEVFNTPESSTNATPNLDDINNVENVFLPANAGTNFTVVIRGTAVNVNAVPENTNNIVQDFAFVVSSGNGSNTNGFAVTANPPVSNPTDGQRITVITATNAAPLMNQYVGANWQLGTNIVQFTNVMGTNSIGQVTLGQTNQWHFYIWTNYCGQYAAFVTFLPPTAAVPSPDVSANSATNATRPEADIDLFVTTDPSLTNLNPAAVANCITNPQVGASSPGGVSGTFYGAALDRGGSEFVVDTNSTAGQVYYIGVQSEDQMASQYAFLGLCSETPFSNLNGNGDESATFYPVDIPDGDATHPGYTNSLALTIFPVDIERVVVTNILTQQNAGDLVISVDHSTVANGDGSVVLLNHDSPAAPGTYPTTYDDSGENDIAGSQPSDGPGSLSTFTAQEGMGVWLLHASDNAPSFVGSVQGSLYIQAHQNLQNGGTNTVAPGGWYFDYIDVPSGYTNLTVYATNVTAPPAAPPLQLYLNVGSQPSLTNYLFEADLTNPPALNPGNSISYGPPLQPARYWIGVYNPSAMQQDVSVLVKLNGLAAAPQQTDFDTAGPLLTDDAVTTSSTFVSATNQILSVNVGMVVSTNARISDYTFTLISPTGQRVLLMENRGGPDTYGAGSDFVYTNVLNSTATGGAAANTNYLPVDPAGGTVPITYNFYTVPDEMTVYAGTNPATFNLGSPDLLYDTGLTNNPPSPGGGGGNNTLPVTINVTYPPGVSNITIIMNEFGNPYSTNGDEWTYTAGAQVTNYQYLVFTEDTNLTATPIKFAVPPFVLTEAPSNYGFDFESATHGDYFAPTNIYDTTGGWSLSTNDQFPAMDSTNQFSNEVSVVSDPADSVGDVGTNFLALARGTIARSIPTVPNDLYNVTFWYRGPGISSWWRGEGDATDSSDPEQNANNGSLIGRFDYPAGEVGQAFELEDSGADFEFAGTNNYIQVPQSASLDVGKGGGFTVEGWINPTNCSHQEPLVEWLAQMPTNGSDTNLVIEAGPFLDPLTSHYYYLLSPTNWTTSETWATQLGGHLATVDTANEENWIYDTFASYTGTNRGALWIGLNDTNTPFTFVYSSGVTNLTYTNWAGGQPSECTGNEHYVAIVTATNALSGLWVVADNNGVSCTTPASNITYGVVEVNNLQTNGVQFWISVTNTPGTTNQLVNADGSILNSNGCLYADIVDTGNMTHEIFSAPGLIQSNVFQHVALTFSTNSGIAALYLNGTNVATTNLFLTNGVFTPFVPKTGGDVLLGKDLSLDTNNYYGGEMDEMSVYSRALSDSEIGDIYEASYFSTNRTIGKFDPTVVPAEGLAEARISFGDSTNVIFGLNRQWEVNSYTFTAASNSMPLQISGLEPGMLLDGFDVSETPLGNLYYLPEQSLDELAGSSANGTWTLEVWDDRANALATNADLVSWQLQFVLQTNALATPLPVAPQNPITITVPPGQTVYLSVAVPSWAGFATNILDSATAPVNLLFNPTTPPTGSNPGDVTLLANSTGGVGNPVLAVNQTAPFVGGQAGQSYYLGVSNPGAHAITAVVEADFDITVLTNGVPYTSVLNTNDSESYFAFDVSSNAFEATFQLLHLSGNADLVVRKGSPLPTLYSSDYGSFNATNADENIYVLTNSSPVPLSAGRWYLGAIKRDAGAVDYTILAKELDATNGGYTIINLTNGVPFNYTAGPGAALTNFFSFTVTNTITSTVTNYVAGVRFELYNLSGNGDLTVQTNAPPFAPPFFQSSQNSGRTDEFIDIRTNSALTNLAADWYLGVPNNETNAITYTILAEIDTNTVFPAFPGAEGAGAGALGGRGGDVYHVVNLNDDGPGSLRYGITSFTGTGAGNTPGTGTYTFSDGSVTNASGARTIVFDVSGTIELQSPLVITNSYLTIAGQTSPNGITVAGNMTTVSSAHDVVIRYVRFRPGYLTPGNNVTNEASVWSDGFEGASATNYISGFNSTFNTWTTLSNQVTVVGDANNAYSGANLLALANGVISNNLPTVAGQTYTLTFAYRGPGIVSWWRAENNPNDSVSGNNGTLMGATTYGLGEVGQGFVFDGNNGTGVALGNPASLQLQDFTIEMWIKRSSASAVTSVGTSGDLFGCGPGGYFLYMGPGGELDFDKFGDPLPQPGPDITDTNFHHVAVTKVGSTVIFYLDGVAYPIPSYTETFTFAGPIGIGYQPDNQQHSFLGTIDELSFYNRALSSSETAAIYSNGTAGKFDPLASSIVTGLAKAQMTVNGSNSPAFFGSNTVWQIYTNTFTATSTGTPLVISGIEPGMLLDAVSLTTNKVVNPNPSESLQLTNVSNVVADHISASWTTNDILSSLDSSNVTVQWSMLADSLNNTNAPHGYGSVLRYGSGTLSFHHNLYADNYNASPRLGDNLQLDFDNNVIYDWGTNAGYSLDDTANNPSGYTNELNYECNYLIAGPDSRMTNIAFSGGTSNTWVFQTNNFMDGNRNGILDGADTGWNMFTNITEFGRPFNSSPPTVDEAFIGYERVQDFAGASMGQRDVFDTNIVGNVRSQSGKIISTAPLSGMVAWWRGENNTLDSVGGNNGSFLGTASYTNGEVGNAMLFNGVDNGVLVPASASLNVGTGNGLTIEAWVNPSEITPGGKANPVVEWNGGSGINYGSHFWLTHPSLAVGNFFANLHDTSGGDHVIFSNSGLIQTNVYQHVAVTYDKASGTAALYYNGVQVAVDATFGQFTPQTTYPLYLGERPPSDPTSPGVFTGSIDEISIYNRALSASEIALIYNAGTGGKLFLSTTPPPLDTDQDGIPDYWETTLGEYPSAWSANNADSKLDGYTALEEYMNWLAAPHALTVTNASVGVDLNVICGKTGNLSFSVTNSVNGSVYLTNIWNYTNGLGVVSAVTNTGPSSNSIAVFTPTNNFGFASFDFFVTNNATVAFFGPVTVSVMNSAVPITYGSVIELTNGIGTTTNIINSPTTNGVVLASNSFAYFSIFAPTNADFATNILNFASGPLNMWFNQYLLPSGTNFGDFELLDGSTGGSAFLGTNTAPSFIPGQTYYLALQNTNSFAVTNYAIEVNFHLLPAPAVVVSPPELGGVKVKVTGSGIQLQWTSSSGAKVEVQWTTNLAAPIIWNMITNPATTTSNGISTFTDDGSQTAPLGKMRFYRLELLTGSANTLALPFQSNLVVNSGSLVTVTNTATDSNPSAILAYSLVNPPAGVSINSTNGVIIWPNAAPSGLAARFTTLVTDNGLPQAQATNSFTIFVAPFPSITKVAVTATNVALNWSAPTNDQFKVRWTTSLAPPSWTSFPGTITSGNGLFSFTDTNAPSMTKFYELILLP